MAALWERPTHFFESCGLFTIRRAPEAPSKGWKRTFPGNDGAVIFEMLALTLGLIVMGTAVGAIGAWLLRRFTGHSDVSSS